MSFAGNLAFCLLMSLLLSKRIEVLLDLVMQFTCAGVVKTTPGHCTHGFIWLIAFGTPHNISHRFSLVYIC